MAVTTMLRERWLLAALLVAAALVPLLGDAYISKFANRILLYGLAALAVDILLGYCGLVSFGHAAFVGIGAYAAGMLTVAGVESAFLVWPAAVISGMAAATVIGAVSLRTSGLYFIMITLAFAQMVYYLFQSLRAYGGDDGFAMTRNSFGGVIEPYDPTTFYYVSLALVALVAGIAARSARAQFGAALRAFRDDLLRMEALGLPPYRYRLAAFALSGGVAGLAGAMLANLTGYIVPSLAGWQLSGELLMMVILGGVGTLFGPILGAAIYLFFADILAEITEHWMAILGPLLILRVMLVRDGLYQMLTRLARAHD